MELQERIKLSFSSYQDDVIVIILQEQKMAALPRFELGLLLVRSELDYPLPIEP